MKISTFEPGLRLHHGHSIGRIREQFAGSGTEHPLYTVTQNPRPPSHQLPHLDYFTEFNSY